MGVEGLVYRGARELPNYNEKTPIKKRSDIARLDKQHGIAIDGYIPVKKAKPKAKPSYQLTPGQKKSLKGVDPELLNPDGTPKVFYHGTPAEDFDRFDMDRISEGTGMAGEGMHFTDNPKVASEYAGEQGAPRMYPVYLLGKKMAVYDAKGKGWDNAEWWIGYKDAKLYEIQQIHKEGFEHYDNRNMLKSNYRSEENLLKFPKTDGVIFKNINEMSPDGKDNKEGLGTTVVMFKPGQIKSATAFAEKPDVKDPRISYQLKPTQKDWNKNSVIKKGVYHGTRAEFEEFKDGGWFAENPDMANSFAFGFAPGAPQIYKAYLNIEKPLDFRKFFSKINKEYTFKEFTRALKNLTNNKIPIDMLKRIEKEESDETGVVRGGEGYEYTDIINFQPELKNWLLSEGFDGIIVPQEHKGIMEDTYFAFNANQIKSATAMADKPTKDPRISYQLKPADQPLELPDETWREVFIRKIVNRLNRLENVTSEIGDVDEQTNA